jgi:hypothetical protein
MRSPSQDAELPPTGGSKMQLREQTRACGVIRKARESFNLTVA